MAATSNTLIERLLAKLPSVKSVENLQQIVKAVAEQLSDAEVEEVYSVVSDQLAASLKREGVIEEVESVASLVNLLETPSIADKLTIGLLLELDHVIYQAKIKWAGKHSILI